MNAFPGKGDARDLRLGEYIRSSTAVWYRCASCGDAHAIDGHDYGISPGGDVKPTYVCPGCKAEVTLTLIDWGGR